MSLVEATGLAIAGRLDATDLSLEAGTLTGLIGPNGSGKTSLLHALAGIGGGQGRTTIDGIGLNDAPPAMRPGLATYLPASRDVRWPLRARDLIALGGASADQIDHVVARLSLEELGARTVDHLSTGERSRVLIARALAPCPRLLLLDEPTANLDLAWQLRLMALIRQEIGGKRAAIVAMHDLDAAGRCADRLIVMNGGRIAADGAPDGVLESEAVRDAFGVRRHGAGWVVSY